MAKKSVKKETVKNIAPENLLKQMMDDDKEGHYNYEKTVYYEVTRGSLLLDTGAGKITPGILRNVGISRGGKTSQFLEDVRQFIKHVDNSRGFWVVAEGRLSEKMKKRSGLKFVYDPQEWTDGTIFVLESNIYETVFNTILNLIKNNSQEKRFFFVIDSVNGLRKKEDLGKPIGDNRKVAGGASVTSEFLGDISLPITKFGHVLGLIGQIRSSPKINQYEKTDPKLSNSTGGFAQEHYPNIFLQYEPRYKADLIGDANDPKGHWAKAIVLKTDNEKTTVVRYPIKYDSDGKGGSIWREYEVADMMIQWGFLTKAGAWLKMGEEHVKELKGAGLVEEDEISIQGIDKLREWLEENPAITDYFFEKFEKILS